MPMYRGKPFEARICNEENKVDITHWANLNKGCEAVVGFYYLENGTFYRNILENCEEVPGSML